MEKRKPSLSRRAFHATRALVRLFSADKVESVAHTAPKIRIKVAFIHNEKRVHSGMHTGAAQINRLMASALADRGVQVKHFYPKHQLADTPVHLRGIANILFFYSMLEHKEQILKYDIIQGTTYTPLPFLAFDKPVVCHFGSTIRGFLQAVPLSKKLQPEERQVFRELVKLHIIPDFDLPTFRPMEDIADIESVTAIRATACIATSLIVKNELVAMGVPQERIHVIHNAIEDYWFHTNPPQTVGTPHLVFLGRLGNDVFTLKLKGFARLVTLYRSFPDVAKTTVCMTTNRKLKEWLRVAFPKHYMYVNLRKDLIPGALAPLYGSMLLLTSRYEGFSLSLIEGMAQGLVPIAFSVGVVPEIIKNGHNGFIVTSTEEAEQRIHELLDNTPLRLAMAAHAKQTAVSFQSETITKELTSLYQHIKEERRRTRQGSHTHPLPELS